MSASLVGSEMCIRDSHSPMRLHRLFSDAPRRAAGLPSCVSGAYAVAPTLKRNPLRRPAPRAWIPSRRF
eukprot:12169937-Alexandrium_andersonii.AAC.1